MKKRLRYLLLAVLLLISLCIAVFYAVMRSQYATQVVNEALAQFSSQPMQVEQAQFTPPLQLTLHGLTIGDDTPLYLPKVELWLHQSLPQQKTWRFDAIVIEQAKLDLSQQAWSVLRQFNIGQLAFKQSELSAADWSARGVNLQIDHPIWQDEQQVLPYGDIQFSAEQLYVKGHALDNLLIDAQYQASGSTVYGASFDWNGAQISGQAEQYPQGWSLINVTIDQLNLTDEQPLEAWLQQLRQTGWVRDINSLDILKSNLTYQGMRLINLDLSAEKITPSLSVWQQNGGYISFNADSIRHKNQLWVEPSATIRLSTNDIQVSELDTDWLQGRLQLQGNLSPQAVHLKQLSLSGIKLLEETQQDLMNAWQWMQSLQHLAIDQLDVNNLQIIQLNQKPFWQISGLNIDATDLVLKQQGELGLWQGNLSASANSASIDKHLSTQATIEMNAKQKQWHLTRLFVPLDQGYIEADGFWDRSKLSAPWQINATIDGLPLDSQIDTYQQPVHLNALAEVHMALSGLAGDYSMLAHSLNGSVSAALRQGHIRIGQHGEPSQLEQIFELDDLAISADRGRITIQSPTLEQGMQMAGHIDLTQPSLATLLLRNQSECQTLQWDITAKIYLLFDTCSGEQAQTSNRESSTDL